MVVSHETDGDENEFDDILNRQLDHIQSTELTDQQIHALHIIVGPEILLAALKLLDLRAVKKLVLESGQAMYEIQGNEAVYHVQLGLRHSCTCQTFIDGVMIKARQLVCAHLLAVRIGVRLGSIEAQGMNLESLISLFGS
ncbi:hypothetical protein H4Q26_016891 [Puccinia striiformis f. sp. tritici PST-130]|uniref:SWIM-type domain-containing protein n=1 Tax=Puccinia striiformis f. sp. tritici PST-78 TaxID=1165861 RepID=A0A0L0VAK9_9BASI|nr:hypothetical protein Pst134EB_006113 [Puccinia striiformis f. sp. tritici]KAI9624321.1 hypothetical protein H4Q26_016891 [Puccinia striiformis f. sp. tritici PST-130]KNE96318.1 hypothetical protein PSTG_10437 [Puccinia striiformis f. sp. tritici PST-78]